MDEVGNPRWELHYWSQIPDGAIVITPKAALVDGSFDISIWVKSDSHPNGAIRTTPASLRAGEAVYFSIPFGPGTRLDAIPYAIGPWGDELLDALRAEIVRVQREEPVRAVVPHLLEPGHLVLEGDWSLPPSFAGQWMLIGRMPENQHDQPRWHPYYLRPLDTGAVGPIPAALGDIPDGALAYIRAQYLTRWHNLTGADTTAVPWIPVVWSIEVALALDADMLARITPDIRDRLRKLDRTFTYRANQVALATQAGIMAINPDKRRSPGQWAWTGFIAAMTHTSHGAYQQETAHEQAWRNVIVGPATGHPAADPPKPVAGTRSDTIRAADLQPGDVLYRTLWATVTNVETAADGRIVVRTDSSRPGLDRLVLEPGVSIRIKPR